MAEKKTHFFTRLGESIKFAAIGMQPKSIATDYGINSRSGGNKKYPFDEFQNIVDDLVQKEGYEVYDNMMKDGEVNRAVNELIHAVISADWDVLPATQEDSTSTDLDIDIADFARWTLKDMDGSVVGMVEEILDAIGKGFSVGEMNFKVIKAGKWASKWGFDGVKFQDPAHIKFEFFESGQVSGIKQEQATGADKDLPLEKFLVYTFRPQYGRVWGQSMLRLVYRHWFAKNLLMQWHLMYMEKFGDPTVIGTYPEGNAGERDTLQGVMNKIMNDTNIAVPKDMTIDILWPTSKAEYIQALEYHDKKINKAIMGETLTSDEGLRTGSMALGNVHQETKEDNTTALRRKLAEFIQERMIKTIVRKNWKDVSTFPEFVWQPRKGKIVISKVEDIKVLREIPDLLVESDINPMRRMIDLPESPAFDNESDTILNPSGVLADLEPEPEPEPEPDDTEIPEEDIDDSEFAASGIHDPGCQHFASEDSNPTRALFSSEKAIGGVQYFTAQKKRLNTWENEITARTNPIFAKMRSQMVDDFNKNIADGDRINKAAVKNLKIPKDTYMEYIDTVRAGLGEIYIEDYITGLKNAKNTAAGIPKKDDFNSEFAATVSLTPLPDSETMAVIEKWVVAENWKKARNARIKLAKTEALDATDKFWITDVVDADILSKTKAVINSGIQTGKSTSAIADNIKRVFDAYTETGTISNPARIRTIVRTNITTARNDALQASFRDPESMVTHPMQMFSAIMDDVTSEQCRALDGEIYRADDSIWAQIKPPLHFNCRSETVPVMADDPDFLKQGLAGPPPLELIPTGFGGTKEPIMRVN